MLCYSFQYLFIIFFNFSSGHQVQKHLQTDSHINVFKLSSSFVGLEQKIQSSNLFYWFKMEVCSELLMCPQQIVESRVKDQLLIQLGNL